MSKKITEIQKPFPRRSSSALEKPSQKKGKSQSKEDSDQFSSTRDKEPKLDNSDMKDELKDTFNDSESEGESNRKDLDWKQGGSDEEVSVTRENRPDCSDMNDELKVTFSSQEPDNDSESEDMSNSEDPNWKFEEASNSQVFNNGSEQGSENKGDYIRKDLESKQGGCDDEASTTRDNGPDRSDMSDELKDTSSSQKPEKDSKSKGDYIRKDLDWKQGGSDDEASTDSSDINDELNSQVFTNGSEKDSESKGESDSEDGDWGWGESDDELNGQVIAMLE
ncbi:dentin sialophosphoprotein-like [Etheostoma cragini]|uniref:dentin sialophosphoprotein-like n=1 Tax=Etheostoma cragini TaxID=417921 RepID=UPI00155F3EEA|nr:dentin sialophosphoprotein-like [Etheostoma cragini]